MQSIDYLNYLASREKEHENRCFQCGRCCGAMDDPCLHLEKTGNLTYRCRIYDNRFGLRKTLKGREFTCVPIKELIKQGALPYGCAYAENSRYGIIG
jgi:uncharacterized cysteine cluster protein YcgN (CxxCxxCC family)